MGTASTLRAKVISLGTDAGSRVYPLRLPQGATLPAICYMRVDGPSLVSHGGYSGLSHPRYQLDCYASSYLAVEALAEQLRDGLNAQRWGATSFVENELDGEEDPEAGIYRRIVDVVLWIGEA